MKGKGQGWVTAEYGMLPRSTGSRMSREAAQGKQGGRTMEIQCLIGRSLRAVVDMSALGERTITTDCDVIQADGGTRTASITGGYVALADAMRYLRNKKLIKKDPLHAMESFSSSEKQPLFDAMTTWNFLRQLRQCSRRAGRRVVVIIDNAKYHHAKLHAAWRAEQEPEFFLSYLPPYSPDLNPIERVWKLTRRLCLHNRYFPALTGVVEAVEGQFGYWKQLNESLRKLCGIA